MKPIQEIKRYPHRKNETLQGWDSADELLLEHVREQNLEGKKILIINDQFGALSCGLSEFETTTYVDSFVSAMGIRQNSAGEIKPVNELANLQGTFDFVLIQLPKNLSFFEDILCHLTNLLHPGSKVICGAMVKHLSAGSFDLLNKYIGQTTTSLAKKKARLIFATFEKSPVKGPYPLSMKVEAFAHEFTQHSNLFSREKLDIGTRFFLEHILKGNFESILDLGCANGIVGIKAKQLNPQAQVHFSDESYMAILSARENFGKYFSADQGHFYWTNCFEGQAKNFLDLVLCNPPFHQGNTIGDFIAWQMFQDAHASLKMGGVLRVIGNSHLGYQIKLKKIFGNSKIVATNQKFMICDAIKT